MSQDERESDNLDSEGTTDMRVTTDPRIIRKRRLEALMKGLGPGGMIRFVQQYGNGEGDYSQRRAKMQEGMPVKKLGKEIRKRRKAA
ncbi:MAG: hypothetical protein AAB209_01495 [Bacteroidota bacterium]